jgi:hypothetical protein
LAALSLSVAAGLSACTGLTPVYGDNGASQALKVGFDQPTNPLEQIVYQDLQRRFGSSDDPNAPQISIRVTAAIRGLAQSATTDPATSDLATATGNLKITRAGQQVINTSRQATTTFTQDIQGIADYSAENSAEEQAAHALSDTLELTIMAALMPSAPAQ